MQRNTFNSDWTVSSKLSAFEALGGGGAGASVRLPHDGMRSLDRDPDSDNGGHTGYFPGSHLTYQKTFTVPEEWREKTIVVEFEGVYRDAVVYVNGDFAAQRPNGYSSFGVTLDPYLRFGAENTIRVEAKSHEDSRWYTGTGIHRDTWIVVADPVHIALNGVRITTPVIDDELATVLSEVTVVNGTRHTRTVQVTSTVTAPDGTDLPMPAHAPVTLLPGESAGVRLRHYVPSPRLWGLDTPHLYHLRTEITEGDTSIDLDQTAFGIRSLRLDPIHGLRINGVTTKLRGGCIHHDNGPLGSVSAPRAEERRVEIMKAAGYNAVRSAHNPLSRPFIEACDRLGMLVIDELADVWTESKTSFDYSSAFPEWWERDLESMIEKDFNHPSVIMYSIGNEVFEVGRPIGSTWGRRLANKVRSLDDTRFVTNAINGFVAALDLLAASAGNSDEPMDVNSMIAAMGDMMNQFGASDIVSDRTEEAHSQLDASGINYAEARYDIDAEQNPNRVSYGSETFPGALDRLWALVEKHPQVLGDFAWTAWDYVGEAGVGRAVYENDPIQPQGISSPYPWLLANCGTIDTTGFRRPIAYWRETVWRLRSEPYLAVHRPQFYGDKVSVGPWSWDDVVSSWSWDVEDASPVVVDVYSDADEIELLVNGEAVGRSTVGAEKAFIARFDTVFHRGTITAVAYRSGVRAESTTLKSASEDRTLLLTADRTHLDARGEDLSFVEIVVADSDGNAAVNALSPITVTVEGAGDLVGFGTGQPDAVERFDASTRTPFDGRALAIVRATGPGTISVTAHAEGLPAATIGLSAADEQ